jgi:hypothetical protein
MTPLGRDFHNFARPLELDIRYPVEMSEVTNLPPIVPGGQTLVRFSLKNILAQGLWAAWTAPEGCEGQNRV